MASDNYLRTLLSKYSVNIVGAKTAVRTVYPVVRQWGNKYLLDADFSGSIAKGTGVSLSTDADVFVSISSSTQGLSQTCSTPCTMP
jgi:tRNA nucleotidyltransferase (CCA-adding enzyme)